MRANVQKVLGQVRGTYKLGGGKELQQSLGRRSNMEEQLGFFKLLQHKESNGNKGSRELSSNDEHTRAGGFWGGFYSALWQGFSHGLKSWSSALIEDLTPRAPCPCLSPAGSLSEGWVKKLPDSSGDSL